MSRFNPLYSFRNSVNPPFQESWLSHQNTKKHELIVFLARLRTRNPLAYIIQVEQTKLSLSRRMMDILLWSKIRANETQIEKSDNIGI
jgi:hypothetical protein